VFKNKKMAGHMGDRQVTTLNLKVVAIDVEQDLILLAGAVPGSENAVVEIRDAVKRPLHKDAPMPAGLKAKASADGQAA
jgi:large subunit ribosomal protein L3